MTTKAPAALLLLLSMGILGCGTRTGVPDRGSEVLDPYGDHPAYTGDPFAGFAPVSTVTFPAEHRPEETAASSGVWSVQIAACATMEAAEALRSRVESFFEEPVFIDRIGGYWKVRVGAYGTAEETAQLRGMMRDWGYPDAWSVERETMP